MSDSSKSTIDEALDLARSGMAYEACERLWPLVRDPETRDEAVFTLAYCFEHANNLPTAAYLYAWVADHHPEFDVAARRVERCRATLDARGLHEDFTDSGHVDCPCGAFRYRAELGLCPYCGTSPGQPETEASDADADQDVSIASDEASASKPPSAIVLENVRRDLERIWGSIQERFDEFQHREDLTGPAHHAQVLTRELSDRARKFAESERAQSLKRAAGQARERTSEQLRAAGDRDDVQQARTRLEEWTRDAADRLEELARDERVKAAGRTAYETLERLVERMQGVIDRAMGRTPDDREDQSKDPPREDEP